jgi:type II secretory pathway pseudopilin PulG
MTRRLTASRTSAAAAAFSLVELLVVVGIIALLIAIFLPTLSRARQQANRTKCLNNIRQVGVGIAVYLHDNKDLPPLDEVRQKTPVFYAAEKNGLLSLRQSFNLYNLVCPEGWASGGNDYYYLTSGISPSGSAYMDYAYWPHRYAPVGEYNVHHASFLYRRGEKGTKILVTDIVTDQSDRNAKVTQTVGAGNHGSNHAGQVYRVQWTDGKGSPAEGENVFLSTGASVLFSDYHAEWFRPQRLTQQANGMCYPPPDQWR